MPKKAEFRGIGKEPVKGYLGQVEIRINSKAYDITAIFAQIGHLGHGILGQRGFFDHFDVRLSYQNQEIEINPTRRES